MAKVDIERVLNAMMRVIQERVAAGDDVTLMGFGTFTASVRKARGGYDPHKGEAVRLPEIVLPRFKAGKDFKLSLNKKKASS